MADIVDYTVNVNIMNDEGTKKVSVISDGSIERLAVNTIVDTYNYRNILGAGTTVIKSGAGRLHIVNNNAGLGSMIIYDNTAGSGTKIATLSFNNNLNYSFDCDFTIGLTVVTSGASQDSTVIYK